MSTESDAESRRTAAYRFALAFFDQLAHSGVRHVCISPGSRSTPLSLSAAAVARARDNFDVSVHIDERSAGFFALGMAKALGVPVALVCTSGTAAANYLPAVVEANHAGVPLLVLSADRPPELRDRGAGQTIDQVEIYGTNVRWFHELAVPEAGGPTPALARSIAARCVSEAGARPRGPVHLNWPLREPLDPAEVPLEIPNGHPVEIQRAVPESASADLVETLEALVRARPKGIIACGPGDDADPAFCEAVAAFSEVSGWPLLAEPTSGLRGEGATALSAGAAVIAHSELFLRDAVFARSHTPDVVVRIGRSPTSKAQRLWLEASPPPEFLLVDPDRCWNDAGTLATRWTSCEPASLCSAVVERLRALPPENRGSSPWLADFLEADRAAQRSIESVVTKSDRLLSAEVVRELAAGMAADADAWLYVSNSMAVRDVDSFWPVESSPRRVLSSRGASGIDGVTSSALGAAVASGRRVCLLTGDLAFLHDVGGLLAARSLPLRATILVVNDDGGGIFSYLPVAAHGEAVEFERLFRTPTGVDLSHAAALVGARWFRVDPAEGAPALRSALRESFACDGLSIVEVPVDRDANVAQHRAIDEALRAELEADRS
ncbi:MAG: 2-succinyl-5-enolpyruvyl-6-hydroxy-3-cyclohexene-1-carboxylic-acid synthase [Myxococcota bacterium]|nr:2-succinyl-5-enolpyruvyl-6-hydroxy-3-cyclohexene-1-carboxylic-acid synthase [Myxococcota bacterium]